MSALTRWAPQDTMMFSGFDSLQGGGFKKLHSQTKASAVSSMSPHKAVRCRSNDDFWFTAAKLTSENWARTKTQTEENET